MFAIADRFLASGEGWSTFNHISLLAVLSVPGRGHRDTVEGSAVLGLRRLELLRRVLGEYWTRSADAVTLAWIEALGYEVAYTGEGSAWTVSDEAYLTLYERHRADAFAEEILWTFASELDGPSCEGDPICYAEHAVNERLARYWADLPGGRYIAQAIELGRTRLGGALEQCSAARTAGPGSRAARNWEWYRWDDRGPEIVRVFLPDSSLAVADDRSFEVVFLDPDGSLRARSGGEGRGPGEYTSIGRIGVGVDGVPFVFDSR